jgi:hypothetical protein
VAQAQRRAADAQTAAAHASAKLAGFSAGRYREEARRCDELRASDLRDFMVRRKASPYNYLHPPAHPSSRPRVIAWRVPLKSADCALCSFFGIYFLFLAI